MKHTLVSVSIYLSMKAGIFLQYLIIFAISLIYVLMLYVITCPSQCFLNFPNAPQRQLTSDVPEEYYGIWCNFNTSGHLHTFFCLSREAYWCTYWPESLHDPFLSYEYGYRCRFIWSIWMHGRHAGELSLAFSEFIHSSCKGLIVLFIVSIYVQGGAGVRGGMLLLALHI